jgi:hypothetical protein
VSGTCACTRRKLHLQQIAAGGADVLGQPHLHIHHPLSPTKPGGMTRPLVLDQPASLWSGPVFDRRFWPRFQAALTRLAVPRIPMVYGVYGPAYTTLVVDWAP